MSLNPDQKANINNQSINMISINTVPTIRENEASIYYDNGDNNLKFVTSTGVNTISAITKRTLIVTNLITNLTQEDSGKIIILKRLLGLAIILPPIADITVGTNFKFINGLSPIGGDYDINLGVADVQLFHGVISGPEVTVALDYRNAVDDDTITFVDGISIIGDFIELIFDGDNWLLSGMALKADGIAIA